MSVALVKHSIDDGVATLVIDRPKVNALNDELMGELKDRFDELRDEVSTRAVVLTGAGSFFSFGLDVPGYMDYSKEEFKDSFTKFAQLYAGIFEFPKPVVAAVNGHAVAMGCVFALACDYRVFVTGKAKIGLNEITFGSTLPAGVVEILKYAVGEPNAARVLYEGGIYTADTALDLGLVHKAVEANELQTEAGAVASDLASKNEAAFRSVKTALRGPVIEEIRRREERSIEEFVDIWYSEPVRKNLAKIEIR
ncbi:MAG: enoyl-CoA hydratase/isomerase family protein [Thermodesulfobacteriota bacterium]